MLMPPTDTAASTSSHAGARVLALSDEGQPGGQHPLDGAALTIRRIEANHTWHGNSRWTGWAVEDSQPVKLTIWPEDLYTLEQAGYDVRPFELPGEQVVCFDVITRWEPRNGLKIAEAIPPPVPYHPAITRLEANGPDLAAGDVIQIVGRRLEIVEIEPPTMPTPRQGTIRPARVRWDNADEPSDYTFSGFALKRFVVVGGPKLAAASSNPALIRVIPAGYSLWIGEHHAHP